MEYRNISIVKINGIGKKRVELYAKLDILSCYDLLTHYPRMYQDLSKVTLINNAPYNEVCAIKARVVSKQPKTMIRKGLTIFKAIVTDDETDMFVTFFNNVYAYDRLKENEEYIFFGKVTGGFLKKEMSSPVFDIAETEHKIKPIYRLTEGITSKMIQTNVGVLLKNINENFEEPLTKEIIEKNELCNIGFAYENIHFPATWNDMYKARRRLAFDELFTLQIGLMRLKSRNRKLSGARMEKLPLDKFYNCLPFTPTNAQIRAIGEAIEDMCSQHPMNRLLQGDVGSGKTLVAAALIYLCFENGYQSALMAPTEILAQQHYKSIGEFLGKLGVKIGLVTGSTKPSDKKIILESLKNGEINFIIGTHAIIQESVEFKNLGLVITDEQHRFGVNQRNMLSSKGDNPHTFVMSATPIPRTLALIIYGDLDVSILDELPPGRQEIETYLVNTSKRQRIYAFIKKHIQEGRQAYIVCPLVEDEENESDLVNATDYAKILSENEFKDIKVGLLHGKMKSSEKANVMNSFINGEIMLLVSTTVIEVGIDVPNSVVMVVENADRFGLSQLHQLRGRVGRGKNKSYFIIVSDNDSEETKKRLEVMTKTSDGFKISEEDLKLRGPGDFFGERQHGLPNLKIANLSNDMALLKTTQDAAKELLKDDFNLEKTEHKGIKSMVETLFNIHGINNFN